MKLFLTKNRDAITARWTSLTLATYPEDSANFFKREKNPFANPVGDAISSEIVNIYDEILRGPNLENLYGSLDRILRIRAIQEMSASDAVGFVFFLKRAVREKLGEEEVSDVRLEELLEFEGRIDRVALLAFEIYMSCREQLFRIQANELRNRSAKLLERTNIFCSLDDDALKPPGTKSNKEGSGE